MRAQRLFHLPLLVPLARTFARRRIRRVMRGFRRLRSEGRLIYPAAIMRTLTTREVSPGALPRWFYGAPAPTGELAVRQYMLIRVLGTIALNNTMLASIGDGGPVVYPLAKEWRRYLCEQGHTVAGGRSAVICWAYVVFLWAFGVYGRGVSAGGRCGAGVPACARANRR